MRTKIARSIIAKVKKARMPFKIKLFPRYILACFLSFAISLINIIPTPRSGRKENIPMNEFTKLYLPNNPIVKKCAKYTTQKNSIALVSISEKVRKKVLRKTR